MNKQTNSPLVSVITITYNRADLIHRCIESIQKQTYANYEHIIVDGNSTDNTEYVVKSYNDSHIKYIKLSTRGPQVQMKAGSSAAEGKYVTFLDDDDEYLPEKIEKQVALFESLPEDYGIVYCWMSYYPNDNPNKQVRIHATKLRGYVGGITPTAPLVNGTPTLMIRRDVFNEYGGTYNDSIGIIMSDWELVARITQKYKVDYVPESLIKVYVNHGHAQLSTNFYSDKATKIITFSNHFLNTYSELFKHYPYKANYHLNALYRAYFVKGDIMNGIKYYFKLLSTRPSLKQILSLPKALLEINKK